MNTHLGLTSQASKWRRSATQAGSRNATTFVSLGRQSEVASPRRNGESRSDGIRADPMPSLRDSGDVDANTHLGLTSQTLPTSLRSAHCGIPGSCSPAGTKALCRVREHPVSVAPHGSPPVQHPRCNRGCWTGGEGSQVRHSPGITIPGKELPSLRDSQAMPFGCFGIAGNVKD